MILSTLPTVGRLLGPAIALAVASSSGALAARKIADVLSRRQQRRALRTEPYITAGEFPGVMVHAHPSPSGPVRDGS